MATLDPTNCDSALRSRLASVLPKDRQFGIYHISTPPTKSDALYSAPPNERPDRTYCESHFLCVSIDATSSQGSSSANNDTSLDSRSKRQVLVLGIEILLYSTAHSTTLFVSKADSTGYLNLLKLPKSASSPIREVCAAFVQHLVEKRRRKDVQFIVSLFARSQDQYLFPGSIKYSGKHVLDDRALIKWWCRVLNPLIEPRPGANGPSWESVKGYLVIPGLDAYETRAFVPRDATASSWSLSHPLQQISHYTREFDWVPPRCLIPRFPDDPKSRFRDELDEEAASSSVMKETGGWKSVRSVDAFWEMMAFRQECSSGRMTGFIWVVFDDADTTQRSSTPNASSHPAVPANGLSTPKKQSAESQVSLSTTPRKLFPSKAGLAKNDDVADSGSGSKTKVKSKSKSKKPKTKLRGIIKPRLPRIKTEQRNYLLDRPTSTAYYYWPQEGRGQRVFRENDYKRIVELLLHLDFATLDKALGSTRRWLSEVGIGSHWGYQVTGMRGLPTGGGQDGAAESSQVNNLSGLVKRKRANTTGEDSNPSQSDGKQVNVISGGLIRKKLKGEDEQVAQKDESGVANVLSRGL